MALRDEELAIPRKPPPGPISYEELLEWADEDTWAEWVDGEVVLMPVTVTKRNALILWLLQVLFGLATEMGRLGNAYSEPFQMRLPALRRGRAPDLFFVRPDRLHLMERHYMHGPADLVVEIVSPESVRRDRVVKLAEYEQAGVREYWLIDAEHPGAESWDLTAAIVSSSPGRAASTRALSCPAAPSGRVVLAGTRAEHRRDADGAGEGGRVVPRVSSGP